MKKSLLLIHTVLCGVIVTGCVTPNSKQFEMNTAQAEANRAYVARLQQDDRDRDHVERMRQAQAQELATRNTPDSVSYTSNSSSVIVPF